MKHLQLLLLAVFISTGFCANAQNSEKMQKLKTLKIGFITESLELTEDEAADFWPIYNFYQDKIHQLFRQNRKLRYSMKGEHYFDDLTDAEAEKILNSLLLMDKTIEQENSAMYEKLKPVLSAKKLLKLHKVENDFNRKILEQFRKRKEKVTK